MQIIGYFVENLKIGGPCDKDDKCSIDLGISVAISIFIVILGTSLNIALWRRNSNRRMYLMIEITIQ